MKTAISIDDKLFDKAEKLSEKLHVSRSQLFAQAVEYLIEKDESLDLIKRLNDIYRSDSELNENQNVIKGMKKKMRGIVEKW